jgi:DMSO/TMAO reductase YedYZ molybdopterin-dependent catalytic subunit
VVEVVGGYGRVLRISPIQVHVGSALALVVFAAVHVVRHRPIAARRSDVSRRRLLATGGFALGMGAAYGLAEGVARLSSAVAADRIATGSHRLDAAAIPATTWLFDRVPDLDPATSRVLVAGASLGRAELDRLGRPVRARLDCTSGWYAEATWTGVPLDVLLNPAALAGAASVQVTSTTGYQRRFPTSEAASLWLATRLEGRPLAAGQGAPVRLVAPGRRGFWWVKWVASVELSGLPPAAQSPFPLQ